MTRYRPHDRAWYERRLTGIGGSEAGAAIGVSRWLTRRGLIESKGRRLIPDPDAKERLRLRMGRELEPILLEHAWEQLEERHGVGTVPRPRTSRRLYRAPLYPFVIANVDGFIGDAMVELKTDAWGYEPWGATDADYAIALPPSYAAQVQHGLLATDRDRAIVFVNIALGEERLYEVPRDEGFLDLLIESEEAVWDRVLEVRARLAADPTAPIDDLLPPVDGTDSTERYLRKRYPIGDGVIRTATDAEAEVLRSFRLARLAVARAQELEAVISQRVEELIGESEGIAGPGEVGTVTWSRSKDGTTTEHKKVAVDLGELLLRLEAHLGPAKLRELARDEPAWFRFLSDGTVTRGLFATHLERLRAAYAKPSKGSRSLVVPRSWSQPQEVRS